MLGAQRHGCEATGHRCRGIRCFQSENSSFKSGNKERERKRRFSFFELFFYCGFFNQSAGAAKAIADKGGVGNNASRRKDSFFVFFLKNSFLCVVLAAQVYYNRLGLKRLLRPHAFDTETATLPRFAGLPRKLVERGDIFHPDSAELAAHGFPVGADTGDVAAGDSADVAAQEAQ